MDVKAANCLGVLQFKKKQKLKDGIIAFLRDKKIKMCHPDFANLDKYDSTTYFQIAGNRYKTYDVFNLLKSKDSSILNKFKELFKLDGVHIAGSLTQDRIADTEALKKLLSGK